MLYIIFLMVGGAIGLFTAALFGAGKIQHLQEQNDSLWKQFQRSRADLLLEIMGKNEAKPSVPSVGKE